MMNSTSKPGCRISSSILMTSSSWQTARHRISEPIHDYTPRHGSADDGHGVECQSVRRTLRGFWMALPFVSLVSLVSGAAGGRGRDQQPQVFRGGVDLVNIAVTVTDRRGSLVADLTADDFEIYEDGRKQTMRYFAAGDGD